VALNNPSVIQGTTARAGTVSYSATTRQEPEPSLRNCPMISHLVRGRCSLPHPPASDRRLGNDVPTALLDILVLSPRAGLFLSSSRCQTATRVARVQIGDTKKNHRIQRIHLVPWRRVPSLREERRQTPDKVRLLVDGGN
jgi:hypothetical protein